MQTLHGKGSTRCEYSNTISHIILTHSGLEIFVYRVAQKIGTIFVRLNFAEY